MKTADIRKSFLEFFENKGHRIIESASLIPAGDPTLLFTNAGMVPFKDCFLGVEKRDYIRATSCQKSLRISGKHNDLENVGRTARHHTFFEMLGNFSFGDYFKTEAIEFAWEYLTEVLKLDKKRLWVTIFEEDDEAKELWQKLTDVSKDRILKCGAKDNFWAMGETGPCGPCTEIHYFLGDDLSIQSEEDFRKEDGRYLEIWNLVFMQFNRDASGKLEPLPKPSVDTGMGLERIAAVKQGVLANYDIDLFQGIISEIKSLSKKEYVGKSYQAKGDAQQEIDIAMRVIADHVRACSFLIADGVLPSSDGRGYVLRRLIRRAVRHGKNLSFIEPFFAKVAKKTIELMGDAYPELKSKSESIQTILEREEKKFLETLDTGLEILNKEIQELKGKTFSGEVAFLLHDTYGFPLDLTEDIVSSKGIKVDAESFYRQMQEQKERSRTARAGEAELLLRNAVKPVDTSFVGYDLLEFESKVIAIYSQSGEIKEAKEGQEIAIITEQSPFYAESGGQVGDSGVITSSTCSISINDTQKIANKTIVHLGVISEGKISLGEGVRLEVDKNRRAQIATNHSATHLLHLALREVLGEHATQRGSRVSDTGFRFDFSHDSVLSEEELSQINSRVNQLIRQNYQVLTSVLPIEEARNKGAMALFGEKYGDFVRVVEIGPDSVEFCGGTHVLRSGDIGSFCVLADSSISSGVRRIEALSGICASQYLYSSKSELEDLSRILNVKPGELSERIEKINSRVKELEQEIAKSRTKSILELGQEIAKEVEKTSSGACFVAKKIENASPSDLRDLADSLRAKLQSVCIALVSVNEDKAIVLSAVTKDLTKSFNAGSLVKEMAAVIGAKGGGRPDLAQAGGGDPKLVDRALEKFREIVS